MSYMLQPKETDQLNEYKTLMYSVYKRSTSDLLQGHIQTESEALEKDIMEMKIKTK